VAFAFEKLHVYRKAVGFAAAGGEKWQSRRT